MVRHLLICLGIAGLSAVTASSASAQVFGHRGHACHQCQLPVAQCHCQSTRPVMQTTLQPQQVVTYRDVTETHTRQEQYVEQVPVTTCRNVTVDEGSYQSVWVPKPVTRQVSQTVMSQQVKTRTVPYQVTRRVPEVTTALRPVQSISYVTDTIPLPPGVAQPSIAQPQLAQPQYVQPQFVQSPVDPCLPSGSQTYQPLLGSAYSPSPQPISTGAVFNTPTIIAPTPRSASLGNSLNSPTPAVPSGGVWQPIPARHAQEPAYDGGSSRPVPRPDDAAKLPRKTSMTAPAPSAAMVWSSRHSSLIR